jgi:hypothetical protein
MISIQLAARDAPGAASPFLGPILPERYGNLCFRCVTAENKLELSDAAPSSEMPFPGVCTIVMKRSWETFPSRPVRVSLKSLALKRGSEKREARWVLQSKLGGLR